MKFLLKRLTGAYRLDILFNHKKRMRLGAFLCGLLGIGIFTADQLLKASIERQPDDTFPRDVPGTNGAARYEKCRNDGFMLGTFREQPELVRIFPAVLTAGLFGRLVTLFGLPGRAAEKLGLTLAVSGAASNVWDRLTRGYVVDFLSIKKGFLAKIVINLGDIAIFAGAFTIAAGSLLSSITSTFSSVLPSASAFPAAFRGKKD